METEYLYTKEQAAELRQKMIETHILPQVKAAFTKYDRLQSAMILVAQYWCDEANDAVHYELLLSVLPTPAFPIEFVIIDDEEIDPTNLPELPTRYDILYQIDQEFEDQDDLEVEEEDYSMRYWEDNGEAIPAFAAFCIEGGDQEMESLEAYTPYAIFRRKGTEIKEVEIETTIVGEMLRPWLDGARPEEWEDEEV
jgi:hypothetical protein